MFTDTNGILAIWHDLQASGADNFREWHTREHMPERLSVPGFLLGCRYEAVDSSPQVFNFYLTQSPATLSSPAYLQRLNNPSDWTKRSVPALQDVYRAAGRVAASHGVGQGGAMATLRFETVSAQRDTFKNWYLEEGINQLLEQPGIVRAHLWQADNATSGIETVESAARGGNAAVLEWTIAIEANDIPLVQSATKWLQQQKYFIDSLCNKSMVGFYRLAHCLRN